ncbi:hypothetical protein M011DRAFT_178871 [Sporormia fimetaria CBS 119925]|uniref:Uncharacterized protein n=1 Tax=Sporormia fimetaria CBS 119925 TaxID=1340428 RepID=A0A6A6VLI5_9PLEO|nr:hypothetical protein M011DRAFT_178871 [Sporormia fimetaria CBS 119925]
MKWQASHQPGFPANAKPSLSNRREYTHCPQRASIDMSELFRVPPALPRWLRQLRKEQCSQILAVYKKGPLIVCFFLPSTTFVASVLRLCCCKSRPSKLCCGVA